MFNCTKCNYTSKKETTLNGHMKNNYKYHQCKDCKEKLKNSMELLIDVANIHSKDQEEVQEIKSKKDSYVNKAKAISANSSSFFSWPWFDLG